MTYCSLGVCQGSLQIPSHPFFLLLSLLPQLFFTLPANNVHRDTVGWTTEPQVWTLFWTSTPQSVALTLLSSRCPWFSSSSPGFLRGCSPGSAAAETGGSRYWPASPKCWGWSFCRSRRCDEPLTPFRQDCPASCPVNKRLRWRVHLPCIKLYPWQLLPGLQCSATRAAAPSVWACCLSLSLEGFFGWCQLFVVLAALHPVRYTTKTKPAQ